MYELSNSVICFLEDLLQRYPKLKGCAEDVVKCYLLLEKSFAQGGKLLIAGNGGSCADAEHIAGELMKGFRLRRKVNASLSDALCKEDALIGKELSDKLQGALPTIALNNHTALNTAFSNDVDGLLCFSQQIMGYGKKEDVLLGISTSGNSANLLYAAVTAKAKGLKVICLTGKGGGKLAQLSDAAIRVPEVETFKIQELHLPVYHCLCLMLEASFFPEL